jgi:hypothetical protein
MGVRALAICDVVVGWSRRFDKHPRSSAKDWMCAAHTVIIEYFAVINPMSRRQDESRIYFRAIPIVDTRTYILHIRYDDCTLCFKKFLVKYSLKNKSIKNVWRKLNKSGVNVIITIIVLNELL